jgi:ribonucleotide reductase alpha subunit
MAAAVPARVNEAVCKTVNLPSRARPIEVYATAFELGHEGTTVYVDGSCSGQPQALVTATAS